MLVASVLLVTALRLAEIPATAAIVPIALGALIWSAIGGQTALRPGMIRVQALGMLFFGALALAGLIVDPELGRYLVAAGWFLHGVWDFVHLKQDKVVARSFAEWCGVVDIVIAAELVFMRSRPQGARPASRGEAQPPVHRPDERGYRAGLTATTGVRWTRNHAGHGTSASPSVRCRPARSTPSPTSPTSWSATSPSTTALTCTPASPPSCRPARRRAPVASGRRVRRERVREARRLDAGGRTRCPGITDRAVTATLSVFRAADAVLTYLMDRDPAGVSFNPLVGETNDAHLSDIRRRPVTEEHVLDAVEHASAGLPAEGCAGAGTGTTALGFKAGIGTSSRRVSVDGSVHTVGALVQSNFSGILTVLGVPMPAAELVPQHDQGGAARATRA